MYVINITDDYDNITSSNYTDYDNMSTIVQTMKIILRFLYQYY